MPAKTWWTLQELSQHWRVSRHKLVSWIRARELLAINVAARRDKQARPQYRVSQAAVLQFEQQRAAESTLPTACRLRTVARSYF